MLIRSGCFAGFKTNFILRLYRYQYLLMKTILKCLLFVLFPCMVLQSLFSFKKTTTGPDIINTKAGLLSGITNAAGDVHIYKGVPFAAPPVGPLRWKAPQPVQPWRDIKQCDRFAASAVQKAPLPFMMWSKEFMAPPTPISEDCLYLNVWTGAKAATEKRPVIVWIHGGAFTGGSGSVPLYDGEALAKKGVVFVTVNYRLGIFGFFAHPDLSKESPHRVSGNYALLDQVAALQWVKDNISLFGGDANNITVAGQSAGAFSVNALVASPLAKGLFQKAIAESGGMFNKHQCPTLQDAEGEGVRIMKAHNASSLAAFRTLPADSLLQGEQMAGPVVDGYVLPNQVAAIFTEGKQNDVALLTGFNADEGFMFGKPMTAAAFREDAAKQYGAKQDAFLKAFPAGTDEEAAQSQKELSRDRMFGWQNYTWAALQSNNGKQPVYFYYFSRVPPGEPGYGAFHSAEFGYALDNLDKWDRPFTAWDKELSNSMSSYWVNFAATGNPNGKGLPQWPLFTTAATKVMQFGNKLEVADMPAKEEIDFLSSWSESSK